MAIYVFREGITRGHERLATSEDSFISAGVSHHNDGKSFLVEGQTTTSVVVRRGVAYVPWRDGIHNTALYLVEMDADTILSIPFVTGTMFWSVILWVDRNQTPDAEGTNVGKLSIVQGSATTPPNWSQIGGATGGDYQPTLILAHIKTVDGNIVDVIDARRWITGFDADYSIPSIKSHRENFVPNSDFAFGRMAWWSNDWTKVTISPADKHAILYGDPSLKLKLANRWIYGDNDGGDKLLRLGLPVVWSGRVHRFTGNQRVEAVVRFVDNSNNVVEIKRQVLYSDGEETHDARWFVVHFNIPTTPHKWIELEIQVSGGTVNSSVVTERWQLERGFVPTVWRPRPVQWVPVHQIILPWGTNPTTNSYTFDLVPIAGKNVFAYSCWAGGNKTANDGTDNFLTVSVKSVRGTDEGKYDSAREDTYVGNGWDMLATSAARVEEVSPVVKQANFLVSHATANNQVIWILTGVWVFV